eukprot:80607_1
MKLCKHFQKLNIIAQPAYQIQYIQRQFITFNADDDDITSKKDPSESKPLDKNFVFRVYKELGKKAVLGKKSQDRLAQEALQSNPTKPNKDPNTASDYFRGHDRPSHRLFGIYYKMAHSEINSFKTRGFGSINHLMHPMIPEELQLLHETIDAIFTNTIDFDAKKYMENSELNLNLDVGMLRGDMPSGGKETKIDEHMSIVLPAPYKPKIYNQQNSIIKNVRNCIGELKGNYFEHRGLSITRQIFVDLLRTDVVKNDFALLSDDIFIIDAKNLFESLEQETIKFPSPQLVSICDIEDDDLNNENERPYLVCVLAIQNAIVTLKRREFDENNIPPNIPLAGGSCLLVDPSVYSQVLYWRRTNDPATFFINMYGEKF